MRCLPIQYFIGSFVYQMCCGKDTFSPKIEGQVCLKFQCSCHIQNVTMFTFYYSILLGSINATCLMNDPIFKVEFQHGSRLEFGSIITPYHFYLFFKLSLDHSYKTSKQAPSLALVFHRYTHTPLLASSTIVRK